jgi:hypothetical protein
MNPKSRKFLEEVIRDLEYCVDLQLSRLTGKADLSLTIYPESYERMRTLIRTEEDKQALAWVLREAISGVLHSTFVAIDGGTRLADEFLVELVDRETHLPIFDYAAHEAFGEIYGEIVGEKEKKREVPKAIKGK